MLDSPCQKWVYDPYNVITSLRTKNKLNPYLHTKNADMEMVANERTCEEVLE
jgi:hypothetical protein